ncbi:MAG: hypothetical protein AAF321_05330, partial [Pseudomonadota bacterium]
MRGTSLKAQAQGAADAAALAAARNLTRTDAEVEAIIRRTLDANLPKEHQGKPFTWKALEDRSAAQVDFGTEMDNYFLGMTSLLSGQDMSKTEVGVTSVANAGDRAEVALVVDVTGSMKPHMSALREASEDFVDILFQGGEESDVVKVALVPYVTTVNVSADDDHMSWMDTKGKSKFHGNWFERINHKWGRRDLYVSRAEECLAPEPKPKPKPDPKPDPTPAPAPAPTPAPAPDPKPDPEPSPPPKKPMPDDLGYAPDLEHPDAPWQRLASIVGEGLYGTLDAVGAFIVPSALADSSNKSNGNGNKNGHNKDKTSNKQKKDKQAHSKWEGGDDDAWRDMTMDEQYVECQIELQNVNHFDLYEEMGVAWAGCVEMRPEPYDVSDDKPSKGKPDTLFVPYLWPDEMDKKGSSDEAQGGTKSRNSYIDDDAAVPEWVLNKKPKKNKKGKYTKWRDNVGDHGASVQGFLWKYGEMDPDAEVRNEFGFTGATGYDEQSPNAACPDPIVPLTDKRAELDKTIDKLRAYKGSGTNVALGLTWGWRTLSPGAPFDQGEEYGADRNRKIIVLMTDGVNLMQKQNRWWTKSDYTGLGYAREARLGTDNRDKIREKLDDKVLEVCETVKDDHEIEVYTIMFNPDKGWWMDDVRKMLQTCATSSKHAYEATSAADLVDVFNAVGSDIAKLRLTK